MRWKKKNLGYLLVSLMALGAIAPTSNTFAEEETVQTSNEGLVAIQEVQSTENSEEQVTDSQATTEESTVNVEKTEESQEETQETVVESELQKDKFEYITDPTKQEEAPMSRAAMARANVSSAKMYRLYNPNSGEHFYTANAAERDKVKKAGWRDEGIGWNAPTSGNPVYRLYNPNAGDHHYTLNSNERDNLKKKGWRYEGVSWYSPSAGKPLYRLYNPNAKAGSHHYTLLASERDHLKKVGWRYEGIAWYAVDANSGSGGTTTPPKPTPTPVWKYTTFYEGHETSAYDIKAGKYTYDTKAQAVKAIDKYADDLLINKNISARRYGVQDWKVQ